ncbi:amidase [Glycocaulis alkaliphilus]|uniref:Amidase n=1 Tax=Glycocaulis alkaliphilus TaxID=1434191 RepID=A0A3T0E9Q7_9PROT|nr:amidase family protein [Glycocaulis alkaliphilus]AZU04049.1 amidase [Glycocaulis alkaliphilus]GGB75405.1 6-aminohexanoate-cyclic-dimer hydrolase [Glycocaulis alkaliphilus]
MNVKISDAMSLGGLDGMAQAELVRRRELSALELTEAAIMRIDALDPDLQAISWKAYDLARTRAGSPLPAGPLSGVPCLLKDSLQYPGMPGRGGSASVPPTAAAQGFPYATRLDEAGLVPLGKTAMPEFGLLGVTEPHIGPVTSNPWDARFSPGGSSGGAAAAVASGMTPLAHGSDGAGSIRIPASCCGIVGLKPGRGAAVRVRARHPIEDLLVADSLMARTVRDVAAGFALARPGREAAPAGPGRRRLRIALIEPTLAGGAPHPDCQEALTEAAELLAALGHHVEAAELPVHGPAAERAERVLWMHLGADCVDAVRARGQEPARVLEPWTRALGRMAEALSPEDLEQAYAQIAALPAQLSAFADHFDVWLTPTLASPPPLIGDMAPDLDPDLLMERMFGWLGYTPLQNLAGTPAISLPLHWNRGGLPVGVMLAGPRGAENRLLELAFELEAACPWADRWPPVSALGKRIPDGPRA